MKPVLGGMRMPSVPPAARVAQLKPGSYFFARISGRATEDMVTAVAMESPDTAAKPAHPETVATASPPGRRPSHTLAVLNRSRLMPEYMASSPMRMNMGTTEYR